MVRECDRHRYGRLVRLPVPTQVGLLQALLHGEGVLLEGHLLVDGSGGIAYAGLPQSPPGGQLFDDVAVLLPAPVRDLVGGDVPVPDGPGQEVT